VLRFDHQAQHDALARERGRPTIGRERIVDRRRLHQPGDERSLRQVQIPGALLEIRLRRRFHAVGQVAVVHRVEVQLQDRVALVAARDFGGQHDLPNLAIGRAFRALRQHQVAHQLLGDRARARHGFAFAQILNHRARDTDRIETGVAIEARVFGVDRGGDDPGRHLLQRDDGAPTALRVEQFEQQVAVLVVDLAAGEQVGGAIGQLFRRGQLRGNR
jgi:hypothetical protein